LGSGAPAAEYVPELPHYSDDLSGRVKTLISAASGGRGLAAFTLPDENDFSAIPQDPLNPISSAKVELGKLLFHDTAFALDGRGGETQSWSCATCHHAAAGFKAGARQGIGNGGAGFGFNGASRVIAAGFDANSPPTSDNLPDLQPLASPTILHSAWQDVMLWNGQFGNSANGIVNAGIDPQRLQTPGTPKEANATGLSGVEVQAIAGTGVHRLRFGDDTPLQSNPSYQALWHATYGNEAIDPLLGAAKAMAAYERTVIANRAPFQRWLKGDESAMTNQQLLGAELFFGKAACVECHRGPGLGSDLGAMSDAMFFAIGFADLDSANVNSVGNIADTDRRGRGGFTGNPLDDYKFKIPQLYNLTDANVFGHGGSFSSVRSVIEYKNAAVPQNPAATAALDYRFVPLGLTDTEVEALADFIAHSLYDPDLLRYQPQEVPSGLCIIVNAQDDNAQGRCPEGIDVVR
jgi:cytochrome c peroxidase